MKKLTQILVTYADDSSICKIVFDVQELDEFFDLLTECGLYDEIKVSKTYSLGKRVMDRLTEGKG